MKNKGFTLIELLSVIVLLSLLALLVIPKIKKKKEKKEKEISLAKKKVLYSDAEKYLKENNEDDITPGQEFCISVETLINEGYISMDADDLKNETVKVTVDNNSNLVSSLSNNCSDAIVIGAYADETLNGANPVLKSDMIPVTIANDGTVKKANIKEEWYNYGDKKWANTVVLVDNTKYNAGDTIPEEKIKAYYVWIPRYKYKLFSNTTESTIDIVFENKKTTKSNSTTVGQYLTHPAFTYGNEELNGFWVSKFEPSIETTDVCYTTASIENCNKEFTNPRIKPNVSSLRLQQVLNQFKTSKNVSVNSRMMKNEEWGAVAYLSHSAYGLNGKVRINNNNKYKTGCGASSADSLEDVASCQIEYGKAIEYPQSTTGNITGIFDTSGGAWEYMMAVRVDSNGNPLSGRNNLYNSGFNGKFGCPTCNSGTTGADSNILELTSGTNYPEIKEYNLYDNPSNRNSIGETNGCSGSVCYGHAMNEIRKTTGANGSWYGEYSSFVSSDNPFVLRGGYYRNGSNAGVFAFYYGYGHADGVSNSFRVVVR